MKVLTVKFGDETIEPHMLNPGDVFEGFGGSRHPLIAGLDFATGEKQKRQTASLVMRREGPMGMADKEFDIHDATVWAWIARMINGVDLNGQEVRPESCEGPQQ